MIIRQYVPDYLDFKPVAPFGITVPEQLFYIPWVRKWMFHDQFQVLTQRRYGDEYIIAATMEDGECFVIAFSDTRIAGLPEV